VLFYNAEGKPQIHDAKPDELKEVARQPARILNVMQRIAKGPDLVQEFVFLEEEDFYMVMGSKRAKAELMDTMAPEFNMDRASMKLFLVDPEDFPTDEVEEGTYLMGFSGKSLRSRPEEILQNGPKQSI